MEGKGMAKKKTYTVEQFRKEQKLKKRPKKKKNTKMTAAQFVQQHGGRSEEKEQAELCKWVKLVYPKLLYTVDLAGLNLSPAQRNIHKTRCKRGHPDLIFDEWYKDKFCALAIEFKKTGTTINQHAIDKDKHLKEQFEYLMELRQRGRLAVFVCGLENAKIVIKHYLEAGPMALKIIEAHSWPKFLT